MRSGASCAAAIAVVTLVRHAGAVPSTWMLEGGDLDEVMSRVAPSSGASRSTLVARSRYGKPIKRGRCEEDGAGAADVASAVQAGLGCPPSATKLTQPPTPTMLKFPELCAALWTLSMCEYATEREAIHGALAADVVAALAEDIRGSDNVLSLLLPILTQFPREFATARTESLLHARDAILDALTRDAVAVWGPSALNHGSSKLVVGVAAAKECSAKQSGQCSLSTLVRNFGYPTAEELASRIIAAQSGREEETELEAHARFDSALDAWALAARERWQDARRRAEIDGIRRVLRAVHRGEAEVTFQSAKTFLSLSVAEAASIEDLAFGARKRLSEDSSAALQVKEANRPFFGRHIASFGLGARLSGGVMWGKARTFAGPIALPLGVGLVGGSSSAYLELSPVDFGQYLSVTSDDSQVLRTPHWLDPLGAYAAVGWRWGTTIPFVIALSGGAARLATEDRAGFVALSVGTFLPMARLTPED